MRDTKDIADAVFRIRDEFLEQKKIKHIRRERSFATISSVVAAVAITVGIVNNSSKDNTSVIRETENIVVTTGTTTVASESVSTYSTTVMNSSVINTNTSSKEYGTTSQITSTVSQTLSNDKSTVTVVTYSTNTSDTTNFPSLTTTDINDVDCEEVIRMKVNSIKKYLAAISAGAISMSGVNTTVNAEKLYTPKDIDPLADAVLFIEDNPDLMDFDGNGKLDGFDSYALFTYLNEPESLPEGYAERCAENADFNKDGIIDTLDSDLFREICFIKYIENSFVTFSNNMDYLLPSETDYHEHVYRTVSPDAPSDMRELLLNEFVDESYLYGSDENRNSFMDYCFFNFRNSAFPTEYTYDKYNDAYYKRFVKEVERIDYSFDVNEDGVTDLKDLYDIFIYDSASADEKGPIIKNDYFGRFNYVEERIDGMICIHDDYEHPLRTRLDMPEDFKQQLWDKCEPIYNYVYSFIKIKENDKRLCNLTVFELIARYILERTELDLINTSNVYYVDYHGNLMLCDHSVSESFLGAIDSVLRHEFDKVNVGPSYNSNKENEKYYTLIKDYQYMHDNDYLRAVNQKARDEYESGLTSELYDINNDGVVNYIDSYIFELFINDLYYGITAENSILPENQWNFIDQKVDLDKDNISGTFIDFMIFQFVAESPFSVPAYKRDLYYLQLVEQKGLIDLSDIKPYIEKLCKDKEIGDVDFDGNITAVDASKVLNYYAKTSVNEDISTVTEVQMNYMADINTDGIVDSVDAAVILKTYAKNSVQG